MREFEYLPLTYITYSSHTVLLLSQSLWSLSLATHIVYCTKRRKSHVKSIASDSVEYCCRTVRSTAGECMSDRDNDNCSLYACVLVYCNVCAVTARKCLGIRSTTELTEDTSCWQFACVRTRQNDILLTIICMHIHAHAHAHTHTQTRFVFDRLRNWAHILWMWLCSVITDWYFLFEMLF